jgi:hypothetical protein
MFCICRKLQSLEYLSLKVFLKTVCPCSVLLSSGQYIILLSMSTSPESVVFGIAETEEDACKMAAKNALEHLILMTA